MKTYLDSQAIIDVTTERHRQQDAEGWDLAHDDGHEGGTLAAAAACYAYQAQYLLRRRNNEKPAPKLDKDKILTALWPFNGGWWKPKDARRDLVRAAALIVAEIERIDRATTVKRI
jgi:kynureninase